MTQQNITIEKARQILGERADTMKDKDVQEILNALYFLCEKAVQNMLETPRKEDNAN